MTNATPEGYIDKPSLIMAIAPIFLTLVLLCVQLFIFKGEPHIPLFLGIVITALFAKARGYTWTFMEKAMTTTIASAIPVIFILLTIGMVIGTWILSGTVPLLIEYGLAVLTPSIFLAAGCIICSVISLATGSSWGTAGTMGLALMGIGEGLGIPFYLTAGSVVSGAFFGDKLSPLSDTTNFSAAVCDIPLYTHIKNMLPSTIPSMGIALCIYALLGMQYSDMQMNVQNLSLISDTLNNNFNISFFLLIPPMVIIFFAMRGTAAIPGMLAGVLVGGLVAIIFQGASIGDVMSAMMNGYVSDTGVEYVDKLLSKGGMMSMAWVSLLMLIALAYAGLLEKTRCLDTILEAILKRIKGRAGLVTASVFSTLGFSASSDIYVAMTIPGRTFTPGYRKLGYSSANISRIIEDGGTLAAPLIPWNSGGVYVSGVLGVPTLVYAPFAFANWLAPLFDLLWGYTGFFIPKLSGVEKEQYEAVRDGNVADIEPPPSHTNNKLFSKSSLEKRS
ncbi:Na+/H+ antiporter NhaC [Vibrio natriegens]|uniref:Na+/H+ antiporter NhaC n=1 Tax=Vibrio natriegens TaxID=691 RepID=UPI0008047616|nr:Na+/H+ antiporter NhaC [Vibrio natriegens]ANQ24676.1 Na+/H+ antiporter NhaC [Vibrio natriegens]